MSQGKDLSLAPTHEQQQAARGRVCPKCSYRRGPADAGPPWQCPRCGIVYDKYLTGPAAERAAERRRSPQPSVVVESPRRWPWIALAVVVAAAGYGGWHWKRKPTLASAEVQARLSQVDDAKRALQTEAEMASAWQYRGSHRGQSLEVFRKYADQGNTRAMVLLGMTYGRPEHATRMQWLQKAANEGEPAAFVNLGYLYETGESEKRQPELAVNLYGKAARQGDPTGLYALGAMYAKGADGVLRNPRQAHVLLLLATRAHESAGSKQDYAVPHERTPFWARGMANDLEKELSPVDLVKARELVDAWKPGQPLPQL